MFGKTKATVALVSWADVDNALRQLGECENQLTEIEVELNRQQAQAKKAAGEKAAPLQEQHKALTADIRKFVKAHRKELDGKTKKLSHGETGFRLSTSCVIPAGKEDAVIQMLKKLNMLDCLNITERVNRDVLKTYPEEIVARTGAYIQPIDKFWVQTDHESLRGGK